MAQPLFMGNFRGKAVDPEIGFDKNERPRVRFKMEVTEGEKTGHRASYDGKLDPDNIKYTKRDMLALGWKGVSIRTFVDDVKAAALTADFEVEIASFQDRQWSSVRSVGYGGAKPLSPLNNDKVREVDSWFAEVGGDAPGAGNSKLPF